MRAKGSTIHTVPLDIDWKNSADLPVVAEVVRDWSENPNLTTVRSRCFGPARSEDC